jgi:hypothetical protein
MNTLDKLLEKGTLHNESFPEKEVISRGGVCVETHRFQPAASSIFGLRITETWTMGEWVLQYAYGEDGSTITAKKMAEAAP